MPKAIEDLDPKEHTHYSLVSWFGIGYLFIYLLHITSILSHLPTSVKLTVAGFVFCMGPGLALYTLLSFFRRSNFPPLTLLVLSCSLGLTYNFLSNIVIFLFEPSLAQATEGYLFVGCLIYVFVLVYWKFQGIPLFTVPQVLGQRILLFSGITIFVISAVLFYQMPSGLYIEELIVLRKLFDNSAISATNIAFHKEEYTTYFFVPFYLFLAMCAQFSGIDVLEIEGGMWPFTAGISLLCFAAIMRHLAQNWITVGVLIAMGLVHILFLNHPVSAEITVFAAFPDRYGLASGVLIPLALFHFLIHLEHSRINIPAFVGLVYLIVEMTFIHARETLFFLGIVVIYAFIQAFDMKKNKNTLSRIFFLLCVVAGILLLYRYMNLGIQAELHDYIAQMRNEMWVHFSHGFSEYGWLSLIGIPQFHGGGFWDTFQYVYHFKQWERFPGFAFVPLTVCILPVYVLAVDRPSLLLAPAAMAAFGLFSLFHGLHLLIGYAVGAPFIFDIFSILFILSAIVFADIARMLGALVVLPSRNRFHGGGRWVLLIMVFLLVYEFSINMGVGYATGVLELEILVYVLTLVCVSLRAYYFRQFSPSHVEDRGSRFALGMFGRGQWLNNMLLFPRKMMLTAQFLAPTKPHAIVSICIGIFITGMTLNSTIYARRISDEQVWLSQGSQHEAISMAYNNLNQRNLFYLTRNHDWGLPPSVVAFIRENVPELQTWFGGHTLPVMAISNQYAPILSIDGRVSYGFAANIFFLDQIYGPGAGKERFADTTFPRMDFTDFVKNDRDAEKLIATLSEHGVEWVITRPREKELIERVVESNPHIRSVLSLAFEAEGFKIFRFTSPLQEGNSVVGKF